MPVSKIAFAVAGGIATIGTVAWILIGNKTPPPPPPKSTTLEIEINGGFAYVPAADKTKLEVAYLNDVTLRDDLNNDDNVEDPAEPVVCQIDQIGTQLQVIRGNIDSAASGPYPPSRIFDLEKTSVSFPQLVPGEVRYKRKTWEPYPLRAPNSPPPNPHAKRLWEDLQYVPSIFDHHGLPIRTDWRTKVANGIMTLSGGDIEGGYPTDPLIEKTAFDYKRAGMTDTRAGLTDRTVYTVRIPDDKVEIKFENSTLGYTKLVVYPTANNKPVRLMLRGLHAHGSAPDYPDGGELKDFCAFYSLLEPKDRPLSSQWLHLHYVAPPMTAMAYGDKPSPGYFCNGDWF